MWKWLKHRWQQLSHQWLARRIPAAASQRLHHRSLFIFPSPFGFGYLFMVLGLFMMGTNYQNNLMLLLSYFLLSLFLLSLFYCFFSLSGARLDASVPARAAAGAQVAVHIQLTRPVQPSKTELFYASAELMWQAEGHGATRIELPVGVASLPFALAQRGHIRLPRVTIRSLYPFGLFRCWSHLDFALSLTVYPSPIPCPLSLVAIEGREDSSDTAQVAAATDGEDADGLRQYQQGDPLQRVAWKQVAKGSDWQTKKFSGESYRSGWLVFNSSAEREAELGRLSFQVLQLAQTKQAFGLQLPHIQIPLGEGDKHIGDCLDALATTPFIKGA